MTTPSCTLFNIQRFSTEDGPGIRTTLFFKGCPLTCTWCHNPEGIDAEPQVLWQRAICMACGDCAATCERGAIRIGEDGVRIDRAVCRACGRCVDACPTGALERVGKEYDADALIVEVLKDRTFYETSGGGVTLSGGEPLMQHAFLTAFLPRCQDEDLHVALDTSGFARGDWLEAVLPLVDLVLFDLKLIRPEDHERLTGVPLDKVLGNLDRVVAAGLPVWVRTPVIPGCTDDEENLRGIAEHLRTRVGTLERYDLLAFSNLCTSKYEMLGRSFDLAAEPLLAPATMERLAGVVRDEGIEMVRWSGPTRASAKDEEVGDITLA
ncbi:MAG: glycyl-radical enzyme activating protein [Phycisphaerae bacterium]|nr:glycyl-radical enzyme activating protein [Phycisphaerae bacterium]